MGAHLIDHSKVVQGIGQGAAHQKFHGQVVDALRIGVPTRLPLHQALLKMT